MSDVSSAVAGTVDDLFGGNDEAPAEANSQTADAPETVQEPAAEAFTLPELNPQLPEDLEEFLEAPDFDEDPEPVAYGEPGEDEYVDPDQLARENAKLRKRLEWAEEQKQKVARKAWAVEAEKIAPLSRPETINAQSRRAFLRAAREQHNENYKLLAPHIEAFKTAKENLRTSLEGEIRAELAEAWGKPTVSTGVPSPSAGKQDNLERARASRNLAGVAKALIQNQDI